MTATSRYLLVSGWLLLGVANGVGQPKPRLDAFGDPLPEHASARLGSLRFRGIGSSQAVVSPNGRWYALPGYRQISLFDATTGKLLRVIQGDNVVTSCPTFSSDSTVLATASAPTPVDTGVPTPLTIQLWNVSTGKVVREIVLKESRTYQIVVFKNRLAIVTGTPWKELHLHVIDSTTGKKVATMPLLANAQVGVAVSDDGETLVTWGDCNFRSDLNATQLQAHNDSLQVWNPTTGKETQRLRLERLPRSRKSIAVSADARTVAYSVSGTELRVRDVATGNDRQLADSATPLGASLVFSPDATTVASVTKDGAVGRWSTRTGERLSTHKVPFDEPLTLFFTPEGRLLAGERLPHVFLVSDVLTGKRLTPESGHLTSIADLAFLDNGRLRSLSADGVLCRWQWGTTKEPGRERLQFAEPPPRVGERSYDQCRFSPAGQQVLVVADGETVLIAKDLRRRLWAAGSRDQDALFAPDGRRLALTTSTATEPSLIELVDLRSGKREKFPRQDADQSAPPVGIAVAFSPDGKRLVTAHGDLGQETSSCMRLWELATSKELWRREGFDWAAFSPDGATVAAIAHFNSPKFSLLDARTGKELRAFELGEDRFLNDLIYSPDGRTVAARVGAELVLWETATGTIRLTLAGERDLVMAFAYSPDGARLASGGVDTTVLLWDLTGRVAQQGKPPPGTTELDEAWTTLAAPNGRQAFRALSRLIAVPAESVALCQRHLQPVAAADSAAVDRLIAALEQPRFAEREAAFGELAALGASVEPALKKALAAKTTRDLRKRLQALLQHIHSRTLTPEELRRVRAVEVLERIGTAEAQRLLQKLAVGNPAARLSREATAALERLK